MNEIPTAAYRHGVDADAASGRDETLPQPWGFWATLVWALLGFALGAVIVGGGVLWANWGQLENMPETHEDPWFPLQFIVANLIQVAVVVAAARLARWPVGQYLGLVRPRGRDLAYSIAALAIVMGVLEVLTYVMGRGSVTPFQTDSYRAARAAGLLPLLWLAFVIAAPIGEEIVFRGFVFRGWAASPVGVFSTIVLTSLIFSAAHTQYDWFGAFQTFSLGALFGWLRWRTGSTIVTIVLHMAINFVSTLWSALKVEGLV